MTLGSWSRFEDVPVKPASNAQPVGAARRGRVLVIDDEPLLANVIARTLGRDHDVTALGSAVEAWQRLSNGDRYDVILCDVMMPEMSGMEFHAALAGERPEEADRVVFLSGGPSTPALRQFLDAIPNVRVEKPFDVFELRALVAECVRRALDGDEPSI